MLHAVGLPTANRKNAIGILSTDPAQQIGD
jgi:hypothetical protein